jgi:hypothetical protein
VSGRDVGGGGRALEGGVVDVVVHGLRSDVFDNTGSHPAFSRRGTGTDRRRESRATSGGGNRREFGRFRCDGVVRSFCTRGDLGSRNRFGKRLVVTTLGGLTNPGT